MKSLLALSALGVAFLSAPAMAAFVGIDDTKDQIVVSLNDFENGFQINGQTVQLGTSNPATVTLDETNPTQNPFTFSGSWIDLGQTSTVSNTVYFVENSNPLVISDILSYTYGTDGTAGHLAGSFQSDTGAGLGAVPAGANVVVEDGNPFDFSNAFITASATSDVDAVPLPAVSWCGFILLGAVGLYRVARRARPQVA
jgi:hypothetical protein